MIVGDRNVNDLPPISGNANGAAEPSVAFRQAMAAVETYGAEFRTALALNNFDRAEDAAQRAVDIWLVGRLVCGKIIARGNPESPYNNAARNLLLLNGEEILALLKRLVADAPPDLRRPMEDLRRTLASAIEEPFHAVRGRR